MNAELLKQIILYINLTTYDTWVLSILASIGDTLTEEEAISHMKEVNDKVNEELGTRMSEYIKIQD